MAEIPIQTAPAVSRALRRRRSVAKAKILQSFFKTGPGQYGEGDRFLGVTVPDQRRIAKEFQDLPWSDLRRLIRSPWHEERLTGLFIAGSRYARSGRRHKPAEQRDAAEQVLALRPWINNWDLVDYIAPTVIGPYLIPRDRRRWQRLLRSASLWNRRIAVVGTLPFIRSGQCQDALFAAASLVNDREDLIQKAVGWMLREVGKVRPDKLFRFLNRHAPTMPRTMLRYAIERLSKSQRSRYLTMHVFKTPS